MPVLVSSVVSWSVEFRCFVLDRKVETFSIYLRSRELQREHGFASSDEEDAELLEFISRGRHIGSPSLPITKASGRA